MNREEQEREWAEEAVELRKMDRSDQEAHVALLEALAADPSAKNGHRDYNRRRAAALRRLLGLDVEP